MSTIAVRWPMRRTLVCVLAATGVFLAGGLPVAGALAAPAWLAPVNLAEGHEEVRFGPYVGMDAQGDALAVWEGSDGVNETFRPAGGSWQEPGSLAGPGGGVLGNPCLAMSSEGEAVALWAAANGKVEPVIEASLKPPGGGWQAPVTVAEKLEPAAGPMTQCHVAIDPAGDAVAVWAYLTVFGFEPVWAAYRPAGGSWQPPAELRGAINPEASPNVAIDARGDAAAVWVGGSFAIKGAYKPAGQDWKQSNSMAEETVSEEGNHASDPDVAFDSDGDALATWDENIGEHKVVQAGYRPAGGSWQAPVDLSEAAQSAYLPSVTMDSAGDALAAWDLHSGEDQIVQTAARPAGGEWQTPDDLSDANQHAHYPQLAVDSRGDAVAAWELQTGESSNVQGAVKPAGEAWEAPIALSGSVTDQELFPQVTVDSHGDALAAWELYDGTSYLVQAAGYQATGPQLTSVAPGTTTISSAPLMSAPPTPEPTPTLTLPTIAAASQSASIWREGSQLTSPAAKHKPPVGTTFSFALNEQASVSFVFTQQVGGRRLNGKCVAQTKMRRHKLACKRTVTAGTLSFTGHAGTNKVSFQGRISPEEKLAPGKYTLVITATNAAGQRSNTNSLRFTIVK